MTAIAIVRNVFRRPLWALLVVFALFGAARLAQPLDGRSTAAVIPVLVYEVHAQSGDHEVSLDNLSITPVGAPQVPTLVDVDGDLLPDVTIAVNLVSVQGALAVPPVPGDIIAPNVEIQRLVTGPLIGNDPADLRITAALTLLDPLGGEPTTINVGYETGPGGSIPPTFRATLSGLDDFFQPLKVNVSTRGGFLGLDPGVELLGLSPADEGYQGPLSVLVDLDSEALDLSAAARFDPVPADVRVTYENTDQGQEVTYAHTADGDVDLDADVHVVQGDEIMDVDATITRLPRQLSATIDQAGDGGTVLLTSAAAEPRPDIHVGLATTGGSSDMTGRFDVEGLPTELTAAWDLGADTMAVDFDAADAGVGAVEAALTIAPPGETPPALPIPTERQHLAIASADGGLADGLAVSARLEGLRSLQFSQLDDGTLEAATDIGDGVSPMAVFADLDLRSTGGPKMAFDATLAPLPDTLALAIVPGTDGPLTVDFDASSPFDVHADVEMLGTDPDAHACGLTGTICGTLAVLDVPTHLDLAVSNVEGELAIDANLDDDGSAPDIEASLTIGPFDGSPVGALYADAVIRDLPPTLRARVAPDPDGGIARLDVLACDQVGEDGPCDDEGPSIGLMEMSVRNFVVRPDGLGVPASVAPQHLWAAAWLGDDPVLEASARLVDFRALELVQHDDVIGANVEVGDDSDIEIHADVRGVETASGSMSFEADLLLEPLPGSVAVCLAPSGAGGAPIDDALVEDCQNSDPFGDGSAADSPLIAAYRLDQPLDVHGQATVLSAGVPDDPSDDERLAVGLDLVDVPEEFFVAITNADGASPATPMRVQTFGTPDATLDLHATVDYGRGGAGCTAAAAAAGERSLCAEIAVTDIPTSLGGIVLLDDDDVEVRFDACVLQATDDGFVCDESTQDEIGSIAATVAFAQGAAPAVTTPAVPDGPHAFASLAVVPDAVAVDASLAIEGIRHLSVSKSEDGLEAAAELGDGDDAFAAHVDARIEDGISTPMLLDANATITPLPDAFTLDQAVAPADDPTQPMVLHATSSTPSSVEADIRLRPSPESRCGANGTLCGSVDIDHLPETLAVRVGRSGDDDPSTRRSTTSVDISVEPHDDAPAPSVDAAIELGRHTLGIDLGAPLRARAVLTELPRAATVLLTETEQQVVPLADLDAVNPPGPADVERQLESVEVHACAWNALNEECDGDEGSLGRLAVDFSIAPSPLRGSVSAASLDSNAINLVGRGSFIDAALKIDEITRLRFLKRQVGDADGDGSVFAVNAALGGNKPLDIDADIEGLRLGAIDLGTPFDEAVLDAQTTIHIDPLPDDITVCVRDAGVPANATSGSVLTASCEDSLFGSDDAPAAALSPLSFAYSASDSIDEISVDASAQIRDVAGAGEVELEAVLDLADLPEALSAQAQLPSSPSAAQPIEIAVDMASDPGDLFEITVDAAILWDGSVCADPRPGAHAICAEARLTDLPDRVDVRVEPDGDDTSFAVVAEGDDQLDVRDIDVVLQVPAQGSSRPSTARLRGNLIDLPSEVTGRLHTGGTVPELEVVASPPVGSVDVQFENFIAPDVVPQSAPPQRIGLADTVQEVTLLQRGDFIRAHAHVEDLVAVGVAPVRSTDGTALDTLTASAEFGGDHSLRFYADLAGTVDVTGASRTIVDTTIEDVPARVDVCFRPARTTSEAPADGTATWCDDSSPGGLVEFRGDFDDDASTLDVDAFLRHVAPDGSMIAVRADVDDIPPVIHLRTPDAENGDVSFEGLDLEGDPRGIGRIDADVATFDLQDAVYAEGAPFVSRPVPAGPFDAVEGAGQHVAAAVAAGHFQLSARLGPDGPDQPGSHLQRFSMTAQPCVAPDSDPEDYPAFPIDDVSTYSCIEVDLPAESPEPDPLAIDLAVQTGGRVLQFSGGGLTDVPEHVQLTFSDTTRFADVDDTPVDERALRRPCGSAATEYADLDPGDQPRCMAPLVRFDQSSDAILHGTVQFGPPTMFDTVAAITPARANLAPDLHAAPGADGAGWSEWPEGLGIRGTVHVPRAASAPDEGQLDEESEDEDSEDDELDGSRMAAEVHLRLAVPRALTIDQIQAIGGGRVAGMTRKWSDLRFSYRVSDQDGQPVPEIGRASFLADLSDMGQAILAGAGEDPTVGIPIPGEVGVGVYTRNVTDNVGPSNFVQVQLRTSTPISLGAWFDGMLGETATEQNAVMHAEIRDVPEIADDAAPGEPSFIGRFHQKSKPDYGGEPAVPGSTAATVGIELDAEFDLQVGDGEPVRRLDVFMGPSGKRMGVEITGTDAVDGGNPAQFTGLVDLVLDPLDVDMDKGVKPLGAFDLALDARVEVELELDRVDRVRLRQNRLTLRVDSDGADGGGVTLKPLVYVDRLRLDLWMGLPFPSLRATYGAALGQPMATQFLPCHTAGLTPVPNIQSKNGKVRTFVVWPLQDPAIHLQGPLSVLGEALKALSHGVAPGMCALKTQDVPTPAPAPAFLEAGHPVPYTEVDPLEAEEPEVIDPAPPEEPVELIPEDHVVALCGRHSFSTLVVDGTLSVATSPSAVTTYDGAYGPRQDCPAGSEGTLQLDADLLVVGATGLIEGHADGPGPSGNGGGGLGGVGGDGSDGSGGAAAYLDDGPTFVSGRSGGGGALGGALLVINADAVHVTGGAIRLDGESGAGASCLGATTGGGGGSGGVLVLSARVVSNGGTISLQGGAGGSSSFPGGGGGGGAAWIRTPTFNGNDALVDGGAASCGAQPGGDGVVSLDTGVWSRVHTPAGPWMATPENDLQESTPLAVSATVPDPGPFGSQVVVCGIEVGAMFGQDLEIADDAIAAMLSDAVSAADPCGGTPVRAVATIHDPEVDYDADSEDNAMATQLVPFQSDGFAGLWTMVLRRPAQGHDCVADPNGCDLLSSAPDRPERLVIVDNSGPSVEIQSPAEGKSVVSGVQVLSDIEDTGAFGGVGVARVRCREGLSEWLPCGDAAWVGLSPGLGPRDIEVSAEDRVGNIASATVTVEVTTGVPPVSIAVTEPAGESGWHTEIPTVTFSVDEAPARIMYTVDGGPEYECIADGLDCQVDPDLLASLADGRHRIGATAIGPDGERHDSWFYLQDGENNVDIRLDRTAAHLEGLVVPSVEDGLDGWYVERPVLVVSAVDTEGGSGLDTIEYRVDGGPWEQYTSPVEVPPGTHIPCWRAIDIAGNIASGQCDLVRVDVFAPAAMALLDGVPELAASPNGDDGWWAVKPELSLSFYNDADSGAPVTDRFVYRIDDGQAQSCDDDPCVVPADLLREGVSTVAWYAVDAAGNEGEIDRVELAIDTAGPQLRLLPGPWWPTGTDDWQLTPTGMVLTADDGPSTSGVSSMHWSIDGGPEQIYTDPIPVPAGVHDICGRARDHAGNYSSAVCQTTRVDVDAPESVLSVPSPGSDGWHDASVVVTATGVDATSGVGEQPWEAAVCTSSTKPVPGTGLCISVDGGPFVSASDVSIGEGVHEVVAFAVDRAGRRGPAVDQVVRVDGSAPSADVRTIPGRPTAAGRWRGPTATALALRDGPQGSGPSTAEYRVDGGQWQTYTGAISMSDGDHVVEWRATDVAGNTGTAMQHVLVDSTPPAVSATAPQPAVWIKLLGLLQPSAAKLPYVVSDAAGGPVDIRVIVYDLTGAAVKVIDGGSVDTVPGQAHNGFVLWDGTSDAVTGLVPAGLYHYRVVGTDAVGNVAQSTQSSPVQVTLGLDPVKLPCLKLFGCN